MDTRFTFVLNERASLKTMCNNKPPHAVHEVRVSHGHESAKYITQFTLKKEQRPPSTANIGSVEK